MQLTNLDTLKKCMDDHNLHMETLNNARELGGYVMQDGRTVKRGLLLRTTSLDGASAEDLRRLKDEFHLACIIDMRGVDEAANKPDPEIPGAKWVNAPIINPNGTGGWGADLQAHKSPDMAKGLIPEGLLPEGVDPEELMKDPQKGAEFFKKVIEKDPMILVKLIATSAEQGTDFTGSYASYLADDFGREGIRTFFQNVLDTEDGAVLWHCFTGKDRTGIGAALLLEILGADWDTILMDYEVSNLYFARNIEGMTAGLQAAGFSQYAIDQATGVIAGIHPDMLIRAWKYMNEEFGSVDNYLHEVIGLTDADYETLRARYLE